MKAIVLDDLSKADVLRFAEVPIIPAPPGDLLMAARAAGVNRADLLQPPGYDRHQSYAESDLFG